MQLLVDVFNVDICNVIHTLQTDKQLQTRIYNLTSEK